jgi:hypothetical protein
LENDLNVEELKAVMKHAKVVEYMLPLVVVEFLMQMRKNLTLVERQEMIVDNVADGNFVVVDDVDKYVISVDWNTQPLNTGLKEMSLSEPFVD